MNTQNENKDVQIFKLVPNQDGWKTVEVNKEKIQIPPHWGVKNTGSISTVVTGNTPSTQNGLYWNSADDSGIPWFSTPDFRNTTKGVAIKSKKNLTNLGAKKSRLCPKGTVMVSCIATIGEVAIAGQECTFNQQINGILPGKEHSPEYLRQAILHNKNTLLGMAANSVVQIINKTTFELYEVALPPLPEQQRIASVLTSQESRIEDLRTWAQTERDRLTWLTDELLSGRVRVVDRIGERETVVEQNADGQVVEGLGAYELVANQDGWKNLEVNGEAKVIPTNWETLSIGKSFDVIGGGTPPTSDPSYWGGDIVWTGPKYMGDKQRFVDVTHPDNKKITEAGAKKISDRITPAGSLIVSSRAPVGYANLAPCDLYTNQGCYSLIENGSCLSEYSYWWVRRNKNVLEANASGTTFLEISRSKLSHVEQILPPLPEQQRIAAVLSAQERQIANIEQLIEIEQQRLSWLTDELLSGRVRVVEHS